MKKALYLVLLFFISAVITAQNNPKLSPNQIANAPCVDEGFEGLTNGPLSSVSWTPSVSGINSSPYHPFCANTITYSTNNGRAEVVSTPTTDALLNTIPNSPFTGSKVLRLNRFHNGPAAKVAQTFSVTANNFVYRYTYMGYMGNYSPLGHNACDNPGMAFRFYDCNNNLITAPTRIIQTQSNPDAAFWSVLSVLNSFSVVSSYTTFTPAWVTFNVNLASYIGSCVRVEVIASGCSFMDNGHLGFCYYDADCSDKFLNINGGLATASTASSCAQTATLGGLSGFQTYLWQGPSASGVSGSTLASVTSSVAGIYTLTATSGTNTFVQTVNLVFGGFNSVSITGNSVTCAGQPVVLQAQAGSPGTYTWSNGSNTSSIAISPTASAVYSVATSNSNNCIAYATKQVSVNANPVFSIGAGNGSVCLGQSVALMPSPQGNSTYSWSTGASQSSLAVTPFVNSVYTATATALNGCKSTASVNLVVLAPLLSTLTSPSPICAGKTATLQLLHNGIQTCSWSHGATGTVVTVSPTLTTVYTASATNNFGCSSVKTSTVIVNPLPALQPGATSTQVCAGSSATLWADGNGQQLYSWSHGATGNSIIVSPSNTSIYTTTVTSSNGCKASFAHTIIVNPVPQLTAVANPVNVCAGSSSTLQATGAVSYTWNPVQSNLSLTVVSPASATTYTLHGSSAAGCTNSTQVVLNVTDAPELVTQTNINFCSGQATLSAGGASSYSWMPGMLTGSQVVVNPTTTTNYTLTGTDGNCEAKALCTVSVNPSSALLISSATTSACSGSCVNFSINATGYDKIIFSWGDSTVAEINNYIHCYQEPGTYTVKATATHSSGCTAENANTFTLQVIAAPDSKFEIDGGDRQALDKTIDIKNLSLGGNWFSWDFGDNTPIISDSAKINLQHVYTSPGNFCIKLTSKNPETGCEDVSKKCIDIYCPDDITMPNVFTPNGDNVNDVFRFETKCLTFVDCSIFDRWGNKTYEWKQSGGGWDGKTRTGAESSDGTYFYVLRYLDTKNVLIKKSGFVVLLR